MKFWIVRLNASILAKIQLTHKASSRSHFFCNNQKSDLNKQKISKDKSIQVTPEQIQSLLDEQFAKEIINHSRFLSRQIYRKELIYTSIKSKQIYYRAKHKLLFILMIDKNQVINNKIWQIEAKIQLIIKEYENICQNLALRYKLSMTLTQYQKSQILKIKSKISQLFMQSNSQEYQNDSTNRSDDSWIDSQISQASGIYEKIQNMVSSHKKIYQRPNDLFIETQKPLLVYRLKKMFFCLLIVILIFLGYLAYFYHSKPNQIAL